MATGKKTSQAEQTPLSQLKQELGRYLTARAKSAAHRTGSKLMDKAGHIVQVDEDSGVVPKMGARLLHGESPVKAITEKASSGAGGVAGKVKDAVTGGGDGGGGDDGGGGGGGGGGTSDVKATDIVEMIDVGVPLRTAYDHWTEYENFSGFTKGVKRAERGDEATSEWTVKVGPSTRSWKATTQEQLPDDRIVWTSEGTAGSTQGAVSFHEITPTLTRIVLVLVYSPSGLVEKTGNLWRAQGRRARLDFKGFQRYVTFAEDEAEGWRGEIRDGQVVRTHEEAMAEENEEEDEEDEDEEDEEDSEYEDDDEYEDGEEDGEEDEEDDA
ncbi:SRPBCC family protein [Streptomyces sp. NPDC049040]|uniref:SRPBCC family protein n=1 Tax=Streptomyces sp. NPDC049040 TaxID=3365593 RepID=UPI00371F5CD7